MTESFSKMMSDIGMRSITSNIEEFGLLMRDNRMGSSDREMGLNMYRSGSAPTTVEGSLNAVAELFAGGGNDLWCTVEVVVPAWRSEGVNGLIGLQGLRLGSRQRSIAETIQYDISQAASGQSTCLSSCNTFDESLNLSDSLVYGSGPGPSLSRNTTPDRWLMSRSASPLMKRTSYRLESTTLPNCARVHINIWAEVAGPSMIYWKLIGLPLLPNFAIGLGSPACHDDWSLWMPSGIHDLAVIDMVDLDQQTKMVTELDGHERQTLVTEMLGTTDENEPLQVMMKAQSANYVVQKVLETWDD
ncbi:hypothetical protein E3N88_38512 [Mikania micrantha]|uniref:Uncharacterized protein n=1 Tax=Mikania micrantha TaxID=192012 RepID=A0A5N6LV31_9ASTR|nr:hypothetical protein E3N88_38512 [Mikania micrantha]